MSTKTVPVNDAKENVESGFFFRRLGEVCFTKESLVPGLPRFMDQCSLQVVTVSNIYGVTVYIDPQGMYALWTERIVDAAKKVDVEDGSELQACDPTDCGVCVSKGQYTSAALSPDEQVVAVADAAGTVQLFDMYSLMNSDNPEPFLSVPTHSGVRQVCWDPNRSNRFLVTTSDSRLLVASVSGEVEELMSPVDAAAWSPDGQCLVVGTEAELRLFPAPNSSGTSTDVALRISSPEADDEGMPLRVETLKWLTPTAILVGTSMLDGGGEEVGLAPLLVLRCSGRWEDSELTQIAAYPTAEVDAAPQRSGPYLHSAWLPAWEIVVGAHRKSSDQHMKLVGVSDTGITEVTVDDENTAIRLPFAAEGVDNYVVGLACDTTSGFKVPVANPMSEAHEALPASPVLIVATSDAKLRLFTFGNVHATESLVHSVRPLPPPPARLPVADPVGGLDALTQAAKAAGLPSDDDSDFEEDKEETGNNTGGPTTGEGTPPAQASSGWGSSFLQGNKASSEAATDAVAKYVEESTGGGPAAPSAGGTFSFGAPAAQSSPACQERASSFQATGAFSFGVPASQEAEGASGAPAASSGWGSAFLQANKASSEAATNAVAKYVEEKKTGAPAAPSGGGAFSFGAPAAQAAPGSKEGASRFPATGAFSFGAPAAHATPARKEGTSSFPETGAFSFGVPATKAAPAAQEVDGASGSPAASSGWGSAFLQANKASSEAATEAVAKHIEESTGGAPAAPSARGAFSFGAPTAKASPSSMEATSGRNKSAAPKLEKQSVVSPTVTDAQEDTASGLFFRRLGEVCFTAESELSDLPAYSELSSLQVLAVSNRYGVTLYIDPKGLYALWTEKLLDVSAKVDVEDGSELQPQDAAGCGVTVAKGQFTSVALSPDEQTVAVVDSSYGVRFYRLHSLLRKRSFEPLLSFTIGSLVRQVSWDPSDSGRFLITSDDGTLYCGHLSGDLQEVQQSVNAAAWSPDGLCLAVGTGQQLQLMPSPAYPGSSPNVALTVTCPDAEDGGVPLMVETLNWLTSTTMLVGALMMEDSDEEEGGAPIMLLRWEEGWTNFKLVQILAYPTAEVDAAPQLAGPYLHSSWLPSWKILLAAHRKSNDQHMKLIGVSDSGITEVTVDEEQTVIRIPSAANDEYNYVIGMAIDTASGSKVPVNDPVGEDARSLPASPILLVATSDAKLRLYTLGCISATESIVVPPQPLLAPAPIALKSAVVRGQKPAAGGLEALTQAAKAAGLPSDDEGGEEEEEDSSDGGSDDDNGQQFRSGGAGLSFVPPSGSFDIIQGQQPQFTAAASSSAPAFGSGFGFAAAKPPSALGASDPSSQTTVVKSDAAVGTDSPSKATLPAPEFSQSRTQLPAYPRQPAEAFRPVTTFSGTVNISVAESQRMPSKLADQHPTVASMESDFLKAVQDVCRYSAEAESLADKLNEGGVKQLQDATQATAKAVAEAGDAFLELKQSVRAAEADLPPNTSVEALRRRLMNDSEHCALQKQLPLEPPLAALQSQMNRQVADIAQKAEELESVLQSREDAARGRDLLGARKPSQSIDKWSPALPSYTAIYRSINNMSHHVRRQEMELRKLLHQAEQLAMGLEVSDLDIGARAPTHGSAQKFQSTTPPASKGSSRRLLYTPAKSAASPTSTPSTTRSSLQSPWASATAARLVNSVAMYSGSRSGPRITNVQHRTSPGPFPSPRQCTPPGSPPRGAFASQQLNGALDTGSPPSKHGLQTARPVDSPAFGATIAKQTSKPAAKPASKGLSLQSYAPPRPQEKPQKAAPASTGLFNFAPPSSTGESSASAFPLLRGTSLLVRRASAQAPAPKSSTPPVPTSAQVAAAKSQFAGATAAHTSSSSPDKSSMPPVPTSAQMAADNSQLAGATAAQTSSSEASKSSMPPVPTSAQMAAANSQFAGAASAHASSSAASKSSMPPVPTSAQMAAANSQFAGSTAAQTSSSAAAKRSSPPVPTSAQMAAAKAQFSGATAAQTSSSAKSSIPPVPTSAQMAAAKSQFSAALTASPATAYNKPKESGEAPSAMHLSAGSAEVKANAPGFSVPASATSPPSGSLTQPSGAPASSPFGAPAAFGSGSGTGSSLFGSATATSSQPSIFGNQPIGAFGPPSSVPLAFGSAAPAASSSPFAFASTAATLGPAVGSNQQSSGPSTSAFGSFGLGSGASQPASAAASPFGKGLSFPVTSAASTSSPAPFGASAPAQASPFGSFAGAAQAPASTPTVSGAAALSGQSAFGSPSNLGAGFGQPSAFGNPSAFGSTTSAFGPQSGSGQPAASKPFGAETQSPFGQPSAFGQPAVPGSGFGQPATVGGGFGAAAATGSGFGQAAPLGGSAFGAPASSAFGAPANPGVTGFGSSGSPGFGQFAAPGGNAGFAAFASSTPAAAGFGAFAGAQSPAPSAAPAGDKWAMRK